jgi:hypothetical protein
VISDTLFILRKLALITSNSEATLVTEENEAAALEVNEPEVNAFNN